MAAALAVNNFRPPDPGERPKGGEKTLDSAAPAVVMVDLELDGGGQSASYAGVVRGHGDRSEEASQENWRLQQRGGRSVLLTTGMDQVQQSRPGCYNCGELGHLARVCEEQRQPKRCYSCKGERLQRFCPSRRLKAPGSSRKEPGGREQQERPELRSVGGRTEERRPGRKILSISLGLGGNH